MKGLKKMKTHRLLQSLISALFALALAPGLALAWPEEPFGKIEISGPASAASSL